VGSPGVDVRPSSVVTMEKGLVDENDVWHVVEAERMVPETELDWNPEADVWWDCRAGTWRRSQHARRVRFVKISGNMPPRLREMVRRFPCAALVGVRGLARIVQSLEVVAVVGVVEAGQHRMGYLRQPLAVMILLR